MPDVTMPRLSDSMEEGTILSWLVEDGAAVREGEELLEIETDKATVAHAAEASGTLAIAAPAGSTHPVGATIATIGDGADAEPPQTAPAETTATSANGAGGTAAATAEPALPSAPPAAGSPTGNGDGLAATTPLARRAAAVHDVALDDLDGSGPGGRVTKADVLAAAGVEAEPPRSAARPLSRLQRVVADRMVRARTTVPDFQVQTEVVVDALVALRAQLKAAAAPDEPVPSVNDFVVKAVALALREHPRANGSFTDAGFELHDHVGVGIAVAADEALVVPTIADADVKSLGAIAAEARALAAKVRDGTIAPAELEGGTFTVSNLGMFGMTAISPVINVPQAGILGVGAARATLARVDGEIVDRTLMTLTLNGDHRILYGADAARFLAAVRDRLEAPLRLAL